MSRNASLRETNEELQAKVERYKDAFKILLEGNPSAETLDRIKTLGFSPKFGSRSESTETHSRGNTAPPSVNNQNYQRRDGPVMINGVLYSAGEDDTSNSGSGVPVHDGNDPHEDWRGGGYDPNDGRIAGKQNGWHPILIIRQSEVILGSQSVEGVPDDEDHDSTRRPRVIHSSSIWPSRESH